MNTHFRLKVLILTIACLTTACTKESSWSNFNSAGVNAYKAHRYKEAEDNFKRAILEAEKRAPTGKRSSTASKA
ncbi:MAG: hypothetical protein K8F91_09780 [Candidatus Obscuribacterales bacterium]|nr:hypothetical protein [Candidatus Obscuribacterales bacterium]